MNYLNVLKAGRDEALVATFRDIERKARLTGKSELLIELDRLAAAHMPGAAAGEPEKQATERLLQLIENLAPAKPSAGEGSAATD